MDLDTFLDRFPLIAILRGVTPDEVIAVSDGVVNAGFQIIEIPLNSPSPFESIRRLAKHYPKYLIGGGTVCSIQDVRMIRDAGGRLILMPHGDPTVVVQAKRLGMLCVPGVATPTEAFAALANGADALKLYPAEQIPPAVVNAWRAVLPPEKRLLPVGGITTANMEAYLRAGANGFGLGSALYRKGMPATEVATRAQDFGDAVRKFRADGLILKP